ncbi:MAG: hypothetical protein KDC44_24140 [Phaeodactylibacter sp.]|nr:hypothetical protein [Phaeodactylibacter sp.]
MTFNPMLNKTTPLFLLLGLLTTSSLFAQKQFTLEELKAHPDFEVSVEANGAYSGHSIILKIQSDYRKNVEVLIPAGTVFFTSDDGDQILIIVEDEVLALNKNQTRRKTLDGYCTEASDGIPDAEMAMTFMPTQREQLQQLANFLNTHKGFDDHAIQEAVWCVSDQHPLSYIYSENAEKSKALTQFVAELTGQERPWNQVKRVQSASGGYIVSNPVLVSGRVEFATTKATTLKSKIIDADGNLIVDNPESTNLPKTNSARLNFRLSVSGWAAGTYYVVYYDQDDAVILKKGFEI